MLEKGVVFPFFSPFSLNIVEGYANMEKCVVFAFFSFFIKLSRRLCKFCSNVLLFSDTIDYWIGSATQKAIYSTNITEKVK